MDSTRQQKFARLIQKELAEIFQRDIKSLFAGAFITVTTVRVSPDLGVAKVYLSLMLAKDKEALLETINEHRKAIRKALGGKIRNQARIIPELIFYIDDNVEYAAKMEEIFAKIPKPEEKKEDLPPADQEKKPKKK
ncbi:MAG: 30S ribosome-binding factor RbfA [Cytophagaceae bacterium]